MRTLRISIVFFILLVLSGFFYISTEIDPQQFIIQLFENAEQQYVVIVLVIAALTIFSTMTGLPVFYFSVALGFFLPQLPALGLTWFINLVAVMATFWMVKHVFLESFRRRYGDKKMVRKINRRVKKHGLWTVAATRSVYFIPTNIINFSFPLSRISTRRYLAGTMIGLVPETLINVGTGYLLKNHLMLLIAPQQNLLKLVISGTVLALIIAVLLYLRSRKRRLQQAKIDAYVALPDDKE
ncbi:MAG: VTT domain-containing protein [Bacteroidales bacterium]|nr:VTT domain-containing protein [Bacteroidales bacterium]MDT8432441.1 VTT domain-containing protein [Bacteroidales bacterium]